MVLRAFLVVALALLVAAFDPRGRLRLLFMGDNKTVDTMAADVARLLRE